jgi:serine phosphatase RsbU (regulator of sigma subunit)
MLTFDGGLPLAISGEGDYPASARPLKRGERLVVFTDGVVEQPGAGGAALGKDAALGVLARAASPEDDVRRLLEAVQTHAAGPLADDVTIASFAFDAT